MSHSFTFKSFEARARNATPNSDDEGWCSVAPTRSHAGSRYRDVTTITSSTVYDEREGSAEQQDLLAQVVGFSGSCRVFKEYGFSSMLRRSMTQRGAVSIVVLIGGDSPDRPWQTCQGRSELAAGWLPSGSSFFRLYFENRTARVWVCFTEFQTL